MFPNTIPHTSSQRIVKYIIELTKSSASEILRNFNKSREQKCNQEYSKKFLKLLMQTREQESHGHQHENITSDLLCPVELSVGCEEFPQFPEWCQHRSAFSPLPVDQGQPQNDKEIYQKHCNEQCFPLIQRSRFWQDFSAYPHQSPCQQRHSRTTIATESQQDCLQKGCRFSEYTR